MNEKLQYAEMLDIPMSSCNITYKPTKKRAKKIKDEKVKEQLIEKVNSEVENTADTGELSADLSLPENCSTATIRTGKIRERKKPNVITVELCIIGLLIATVFLTSVLIPKSGINTFFSSVFGKSEIAEEVDSRTFEDFSPVFSTVKAEDVVNEKGVMTIKNQSSVYSPCDGSVASIVKDDDGLYTVEIRHNDNFKTVIGGLKYVYPEEGNTVYKTLPIGYVKEGDISVCFIDSTGNVITDNVVSTCTTLWNQ